MAAPKEVDDRIAAIVSAVEGLDLQEFPDAWNPLTELSGNTQVDAIQVDPAGVSISNSDFRGVAPVYVVLNYGGKRDQLTTTDSFWGKFRGHFDEAGVPVVEEFSVDTTPFFAGEEMA